MRIPASNNHSSFGSGLPTNDPLAKPSELLTRADVTAMNRYQRGVIRSRLMTAGLLHRIEELGLRDDDPLPTLEEAARASASARFSRDMNIWFDSTSKTFTQTWSTDSDFKPVVRFEQNLVEVLKGQAMAWVSSYGLFAKMESQPNGMELPVMIGKEHIKLAADAIQRNGDAMTVRYDVVDPRQRAKVLTSGTISARLLPGPDSGTFYVHYTKNELRLGKLQRRDKGFPGYTMSSFMRGKDLAEAEKAERKAIYDEMRRRGLLVSPEPSSP
jgi:hypothetical protein